MINKISFFKLFTPSRFLFFSHLIVCILNYNSNDKINIFIQ